MNCYRKMPRLIEVNGVKVPIKLTPRDLQMELKKTTSRDCQKLKVNTFRTNPLKLLNLIFKTYGIRYQLSKPQGNKLKYMSLEIPAININTGAVADSV